MSEAAGIIDPGWMGEERFDGNLSVHVAVVSSRAFYKYVPVGKQLDIATARDLRAVLGMPLYDKDVPKE